MTSKRIDGVVKKNNKAFYDDNRKFQKKNAFLRN